MEPTRPRFDDAWHQAAAFFERHGELAMAEAVMVRDLYGRIRIAIDDRKGMAGIDDEWFRERSAELHTALGAWSPGAASIFLFASRMFAPDKIFGDPDALWADPEKRGYRLLDRTVMGADWLRPPFAEEPKHRVTLFGIKGGAGRSTAAAVLAWKLSRAGRRVLVVDLDLESPGVGTTLLPIESTPDFGVVDWFVESAIGQDDEGLLRDMVAPSPLGAGGAELWVVPAGGRPRDRYAYLPKLARAYAELSTVEEVSVSFGERLHDLVRRLEELMRPDVVLLDSRAGLHDVAAVTVTRLNAVALLFAIDTAQTWQAYRALFEVWRTHFDRAAGFRQNLKLVAAQVPETETLAYLDRFQESAYDLFSDHLYVETPPGEEDEFNFGVEDPDAPHTPLRIHWSRTFQQFDPVREPGAVTAEQLRSAFGDFVAGVSLLALGEAVS